MRYRKIFAVATLGFLIPTSAGSQNLPAQDRAKEELIELENEWLHAKDIATLDRILADDFEHVLPVGFITKEQELDFRRHHGWPDANEQLRFDELHVRIYGDAGIVNGTVIASDPEGMVVSKTRFTDVFVIRNRKWQAVNAQELLASNP